MQELNDFSPMPTGKYKGDKMENVPGKYLLWLYENDKCNKLVKDYIEDNLDVLNKETGQNVELKEAEVSKNKTTPDCTPRPKK